MTKKKPPALKRFADLLSISQHCKRVVNVVGAIVRETSRFSRTELWGSFGFFVGCAVGIGISFFTPVIYSVLIMPLSCLIGMFVAVLAMQEPKGTSIAKQFHDDQALYQRRDLEAESLRSQLAKERDQKSETVPLLEQTLEDLLLLDPTALRARYENRVPTPQAQGRLPVARRIPQPAPSVELAPPPSMLKVPEANATSTAPNL